MHRSLPKKKVITIIGEDENLKPILHDKDVKKIAKTGLITHDQVWITLYFLKFTVKEVKHFEVVYRSV